MLKKIMFLVLVSTAAGAFAGELQWETNFDKAKEKAAKEGKSILLNFTGSDWCGWCKRLDREVFRKDDFNQWAEDNLILVKVDFPKYTKLPEAQQRANENLLRDYKVFGFPSIYLVDAKGSVKMRTGYQPGGAKKYIDHLKAKM